MKEKHLLEALEHVLQTLKDQTEKFALVGGLAVNARVQDERLTRDIDLAFAVSRDKEAEGVVRCLLRSGYEIGFQLENTVLARLASVRVHLPEGRDVDLMFGSTGIEKDIAGRAEPLRLTSSLEIPVALRGDLLTMKLLSEAPHRTKDSQDIADLILAAKRGDISLAAQSSRDIEKVGGNRNRDLQKLLEERVKEHRPELYREYREHDEKPLKLAQEERERARKKDDGERER